MIFYQTTLKNIRMTTIDFNCTKNMNKRSIKQQELAAKWRCVDMLMTPPPDQSFLDTEVSTGMSHQQEKRYRTDSACLLQRRNKQAATKRERKTAGRVLTKERSATTEHKFMG